MRKLTIISCAIVLCMGAIAQDFETIYTLSGDVYKGYIAEQVPGNTISVYATDATLTLAMNDIQNLRDEYRKVNNLSPAAQSYCQAARISTEYVKLCSFDYKGMAVDNALKLNQTNDSLCVRIFTPKTYRLAWKEIVKVQKNFDEEILYQILDVVALKDGSELRGRVVEQIMGKTMTIQHDTASTTIAASDISSLRIDISSVEDVFTHVPLLDLIVLKNDSTITGLVLSRMMGKHITIISKADNQETIIPLAEIKCYKKTQNPDYKEQAIQKPELCVFMNNIEAKWSSLIEDKGVENGMYAHIQDTYTIKPSDLVSIKLRHCSSDTITIYSLAENKMLLTKYESRFRTPTFNIAEEPYMSCVCTENSSDEKETSFAIDKKGKYIILIDNTKGLIINIE